MTIEEHAAAILRELAEGNTHPMQAVAIASCHAEEAYAVVPVDADAARHATAMTFLRSLAVGVPKHST